MTPYEPFETYGAVGDNAADCTPALAAALAAGAEHLWLGPGKYYRFNTKPPPISQSLWLHGSSVSRTAMVKAFSSTYYGDALLDFVGNGANGGGVENMSIVANDSNGGTLLRAISTLGSPASYLTFRNLVFTYAGAADYDRAILIHGLQAASAAQGVRGLKLHGIEAFQPTGKPYAIDILNAVAMRASDIWTNGGLHLGGEPGPYKQSTTCSLHGLCCGTVIDIDSAVGIDICGQTPALNVAASVINGTFAGVVNSVANASPRFKVYGS